MRVCQKELEDLFFCTPRMAPGQALMGFLQTPRLASRRSCLGSRSRGQGSRWRVPWQSDARALLFSYDPEQWVHYTSARRPRTEWAGRPIGSEEATRGPGLLTRLVENSHCFLMRGPWLCVSSKVKASGSSVCSTLRAGLRHKTVDLTPGSV